MKAAVVDALGQTPVYTDFTEPAPRDGAVVVTVEASALTNLTRGLLSGNHYASKEIQLPAVAGVDGVARLADGRLVYTGAIAPYGMMAERALVNPDAVTLLPDTIDPVTAAAIPNPGVSAWMSLVSSSAAAPSTVTSSVPGSALSVVLWSDTLMTYFLLGDPGEPGTCGRAATSRRRPTGRAW